MSEVYYLWWYCFYQRLDVNILIIHEHCEMSYWCRLVTDVVHFTNDQWDHNWNHATKLNGDFDSGNAIMSQFWAYSDNSFGVTNSTFWRDQYINFEVTVTWLQLWAHNRFLKSSQDAVYNEVIAYGNSLAVHWGSRHPQNHLVKPHVVSIGLTTRYTLLLVLIRFRRGLSFFWL